MNKTYIYFGSVITHQIFEGEKYTDKRKKHMHAYRRVKI